MPKIHIVTSDGELVDTVDLAEYDLTKTMARHSLLAEIEDAVERARRIEGKEAGRAKD